MTPRDPVAHEAFLEDDDWLRGLARALIRDPHRADDAVQETLVAAWERGRRTDVDGRPGRGWLGSVLRNFARQEARSRGRRAAREERVAHERPEGAGPPPSAALERVELRQRLLAAVKGLEEPYQSAVALRFLDGLPPREVAKLTGVPVKTVHTRVERGLAKLRARLDDGQGGRSAWFGALLGLAAAGPSRWLLPTGLAASAKTLCAVGVLALAGGLVWRGIADSRGEPSAPALVAPGERESSAEAPAPDPVAPGPEAPRARIQAHPPAQPDAGEALPQAALETLELASLEITALGAYDDLQVGRADVALYRVDPRTRRPVGLQARVRTATNGRASVEIPAGTPLLARVVDVGGWGVDHPFEDLRTPVEPIADGRRGSVVLRLRHGRDATFAGRVLDEHGEPLAGVTVERRPAEGAPLRTGADGRFDLRCASWKQELAQLSHPDFAPAVLGLEPVDPVDPGDPRVRDVVLERSASLTATLWTDASAVHELLVRAEASELAIPRGLRVRGEPFTWRVALPANGPTRLAGLPPDAALVAEVYRDGELLLRERIEDGFAPGEERRIEWRLDGVAVIGVLLDQEDRPLADEELWVLEASCEESLSVAGRLLYGDDVHEIVRSVHTDAGGVFRIAGLESGCWWVGPSARNSRLRGPDALAPWATILDLRAGAAPEPYELRAHRGLSIEGRVVDPSDSGLAGTVYVQPVHGVGSIGVPLDPDGSFRTGSLPPGRYHVRPRVLGTLSIAGSVVASAGDRDVRITVEEGSVIAGHIVDEQGQPFDGHVTLILDGGGSLGTTTGSAGAGSFRFSDLRPGRHVLTATFGDRIAVREVLLGEGESATDVALELRPGARVQIALGGVHDRVRCAILHEGVILEDFTLRQEAPVLQAVPAGAGLVLLYQGSWSDRLVFAERAFEVEVGEQVDLAFDLAR